MVKGKKSLGKGATSLKLTKAMRSRISDTLIPPPKKTIGDSHKGSLLPEVEEKLSDDPIMAAMIDEIGSDFEAKFTLKSGDHFALNVNGDSKELKDSKGSLLGSTISSYKKNIKSIDVLTDEDAMSFSSYTDFLEWLEI